MSFVSLKRILPSSMQHAGLDAHVSAARIVDEATASLSRLWDTERAAYVQPVSFKGDALTVAMTSPSAAHGLRGFEVTWMNEINRALGSQRVKKIVVRREGF